MSNILAGIITYNPDLEQLYKNVKAILPQVQEVLIVDNHSSDPKTIAFSDLTGVSYLYNEDNLGIAKGLNQIMEYAHNHHYDWVVTLDQDSVCANDFVSSCLSLLKQEQKIGIITPTIVDKNIGQVLTYNKTFEGYTSVDRCITSCGFTSVSAWKDVGGFTEDMFIDYVDFDFCAKLKLKNYQILRLNSVMLEHQLGNAQWHRFFHTKIRVTNHSAFRKYYIGRNMVYYYRKYHKKLSIQLEPLRLLKVYCITILYEKEKCKKLHMLTKGVIDGMHMSIHS